MDVSKEGLHCWELCTSLMDVKCVLQHLAIILIHEKHRNKSLSFGVGFTLYRNADTTIEFSSSFFVRFDSLYFRLWLFIKLISFHYVDWPMFFSFFQLSNNFSTWVNRYTHSLDVKCTFNSIVPLLNELRTTCSSFVNFKQCIWLSLWIKMSLFRPSLLKLRPYHSL